MLDKAGGSIALRFHARDAHLVLSPGAREAIPFRVLLDGEAPGPSGGVDVDQDGTGLLQGGRLYQLVREHDAVRDRTLQITFLEPAPRRTRSRSGNQRWRMAVNLSNWRRPALAAFRGREAEASELIRAGRAELGPRGEGIALTLVEHAAAVLYNGLGRYEEACGTGDGCGSLIDG